MQARSRFVFIVLILVQARKRQNSTLEQAMRSKVHVAFVTSRRRVYGSNALACDEIAKALDLSSDWFPPRIKSGGMLRSKVL